VQHNRAVLDYQEANHKLKRRERDAQGAGPKKEMIRSRSLEGQNVVSTFGGS